MAPLSERDREVLGTMVALSEDGRPLEIPPGEDTLNEPRWPMHMRPPTRDEIRTLVGRGYLAADKSAAPAWRFWPSEASRIEFAGEAARERAEALKDPDARLGVILDAIVHAFERDPATPLLIIRTDQVDLVRHPHWPIEPDVVRMHDIRQLEGLRLIGWDDDITFFPTPQGRVASRNPAAFLAQRADEVEDEDERSRLQQLAKKLRAGDVMVGASGSVTGAVIRVMLGL